MEKREKEEEEEEEGEEGKRGRRGRRGKKRKKRKKCYTQRITKYILLNSKQEVLLPLKLILLMWRI